MKIKIETDDALREKVILDLFIKEFKKQLKSEATSGEYKSFFLNFKWEIEK